MGVAEVNQLQSDVKSAFDDLKAKADTAISNLNNFAQWNSASINYSKLYADTGYIPIAPITAADQIIAEVDRLKDDILQVNYEPPVAIEPSFQMLDHKVWKDQLADKIETNLGDYIDSMGIPDKRYQDAIFNEDYERNKQILNDLYDLADTKVGARGFTNPNSMVTAIRIDAQQKYQFDRTQVSRTITKLVTEWARENYQFAISKGLDLETFHADFTYKYCTAFVDIYKNLVLASIERFKAELSKYLEPMRAIIEAAKLPIEVGKINADIEKANADVDVQQKQLQLNESISEFQTKTQASIATFTQQINALDSVAKQTGAFIQAASRSVIGIQK